MDFDPELGVRRLYELFRERSTPFPGELAILDARLHRNIQDRRKFGINQMNDAEWAQIVESLIRVAGEGLNVNFNDLCRPSSMQKTFTERETQKGNEEDGGEPPFVPNYALRQTWAIFVGVDAYEDQANYPPLQVCVSDARALSRQFGTNGFPSERMQVVVDDALDNYPTRGNTLNIVRTMAAATKPDDLLLFYYSGHGDVDESDSYLVARDGWAASLPDTAIPFSTIKQIMQQAPARNKVIILDACHAGADLGSKGRGRMSPRFLRHVFEQAEGLVILSSCTQHQLSYQAISLGQSAYTYFLLEALQGLADKDDKGFVTVSDLNNYVTDKVRAWAAHQKRTQSPTISAEMIGEIIVCSYTISS